MPADAPENLDPVLNEITGRRCASCHTTPKLDYVRITNVEHNSFLLAPLAKSAGGTEACGQPVFTSKDDPDYQTLLHTFESLQPLLESCPRADMVDLPVAAAKQAPAGTE